MLELSNGVNVEIMTADFKSVRGYTAVALLLDEVAFWSSENANPAAEIIRALTPTMATVPGAVLLCASSPYARRGVLYDAFREHFGRDGDDILFWKSATRTMNPSVPESFIAAETAKDPASAAAEYGAEFRGDVETFTSRETIQACTPQGRIELPPVAGVRYCGFVDPSGGSSDSMTLAIAHRDEWSGKAALDAIREIKPKFSPDAVVEEFAALLKSYGVTQVYGDRYGGEWPRERFRYHGIAYRPADKTKSEIYLALLPMLNSQTAELLDVRRLEDQLVGLERRTSRGGKDSIDHAPGGHDDVANAAAGALVMAAGAESRQINWSAAAGNASYSTSTGKRLFQHGNYVSDGTNLTKLPEPPPPPADLSYVWDEIKKAWVKPWVDPNSR